MHKDFATSLVVTAPSPATTGTSLTVTAGEGSLFPAVPFYATVSPNNAYPVLGATPNAEKVLVTAIATDTLTIVRAQGGTTAKTVATGWRISNVAFAADIDIVRNVKSFGALGDGTTDDTTAIQNAINAGGVTFFPAGTYISGTLNLIAGSSLVGVGSGYYGFASSVLNRSILKLKTATNSDLIKIATGIAHGRIEYLEIDGNAANNTSGAGIAFADNTVSDEADWTIRDVEIHNTKGHGIYIGSWRNAVYGDRVLITSAGGSGLYLQTNTDDSTWVKLLVGLCTADNISVNGFVTRFIGGESWSSTANGMTITGVHTTVVGLSIDHNGLNGINIAVGADHTTIEGCAFHSNSQTTTNTYSDILLSATSANFSFTGNQFGALDSGITNLRKYAIAVGTNNAIATGNLHTGAATGTAFTDSPDKIALPVSQGGTGAGTQKFVDTYSNQTGIGGNKTHTGNLILSAASATPELDIYDGDGATLMKFFHNGGSTGYGTIQSNGFVLTSDTLHSVVTGAASPQLNVQHAGGSYNGVTIGHDDTNGTITTSGGNLVLTPAGTITLSKALTSPLAVGSGGTGAITLTGLVKGNGTSAMTAATAGTDYTSPTDTETMTNKRITARVNTLVVSTSTYTPAGDTTDLALIASPTAAFTVANPTGTPTDGQKLMLRIKSGATGYAPSWGTLYQSSGVATLPTTALTASRTVTLGLVYDATAVKWVLLAIDGTGY